VTLKRFEFDYEKMIKLKVNDYCEFPINLNLKEYSRQFLRKQESSNIIEEE
jgi:ubiquitin carboxyl-terminal hydrolase 9/24